MLRSWPSVGNGFQIQSQSVVRIIAQHYCDDTFFIRFLRYNRPLQVINKQVMTSYFNAETFIWCLYLKSRKTLLLHPFVMGSRSHKCGLNVVLLCGLQTFDQYIFKVFQYKYSILPKKVLIRQYFNTFEIQKILKIPIPINQYFLRYNKISISKAIFLLYI